MNLSPSPVRTVCLLGGLMLAFATACRRPAPPPVQTTAAASFECDPQCRTDADCAQPDAPCYECSDGSFACPTARCKSGQCFVTLPTCPPEREFPRPDEEAPAIADRGVASR
jgi:hypothetical protein